MDPEETHENRVAAQQKHFASLEAGVLCQPEDLRIAGQCVPPEARFSAADLPTLLDLEQSIRSFRKGKAPGPDGIPDWVWTLDVAKSAKALLPVCIRLSEPIACKSTCLISLFKGKGSPSLVENHRAIALMNGPGKLFRKQLRPALIKAMPHSEFLQGGLPGSLLQGPHHIVRTHGAIALALRLSAAAVFIDVASAYYRVVRQAFVQGIGNDAEVCQILDRLGVSPSSFHTICQWLAGAHLLEKATPHQQRLLREFLHNTHFVLRGDSQLVRTHAGTRPGDSIADLLFALVQADFMQDTRKQLCQAGLLNDQISQLAFGEDKLIAPTWADDSVILQSAPTAELQVQKTRLSMGIVHAEFIRRAMKPNYTQGKTEVVFALRGHGAPAWRQKLLVRQGGLLSFPTEQGEQSVHCVRHYVHLGGYVQDRPAHLTDILRHMATAQAAIKPLRRPVLRDENIPLKVRRMCLQSLAFSCASTTAPTWGRLTIAEDKAWRVGFVKLTRTLGRDDRWTGKPSLPDESAVCRHFGMPAPRVYLRQQRLLHFQRLALSQQALMDMLMAEYQCSEQSWLGLLKLDVEWACNLGLIKRAMLDDFPLSLAEWALHEPAAFRTAVRRAAKATKHPAYEPDWAPKPAPVPEDAPAPTFSCGRCACAFATFQQLKAHRFAVHRELCDARQLVKGTVCRVCFTQFWARARLVRHLQHDCVRCLASLLDHEVVESSEPRPHDPACAALPAVKLCGPRLPLSMAIADVASDLAENPSSCHRWTNRWKSPAIERWVDAALFAAAEPE